jgi:hypothetical protein
MSKFKTPKVGTVIATQVSQENIDESIPCDKGECMLTLSFLQTLEERFGKRNYNVKSTNHGLTCDETYRKTRSLAKARASAKPFRAKLMVESCQKIPTYPPMSEETKKLLAAKATGRVGPRTKTGLRTSNRRQLSE